MLNQDTNKFLSDTLGIDIEQLKTALTSDEEVEISYKSGEFLDEDGLTALKNTVKTQGYKEGTVAGVEMEAKRVKEKFGIEVEGKSFDTILDTFQKQTLSNAKIEPNKKVSELTQSISNLQKQYETDLGLKSKEIESLNSKIGSFERNTELSKHLPDTIKGIKPDQFVTLAKTEFEFGFEDGVFVAKKGGSILKDSLERPISPKEVLTGFAKNNGWIDKSGREGTDEPGSGKVFKTESDVFKYLEENNISFESDEGQKIIDSFNK